MSKKQNLSGKSILATIAAAAFISFAVFFIVSVTQAHASVSHKVPSDPVTAAGAAYIRGMEAEPVAAIEKVITDQEKEALAAEQKKLEQEKLETLLKDPKKLFKALKKTNTILVGESRTAGFSSYGYLGKNQVLGGVGWSIQELPAVYEKVASLSPSNIVFCFGINELGRYKDTVVYYSTVKLFAKDLKKHIDTMKKSVPDAKIFINCIVPCTKAIYKKYPGYSVIPEWNEYLKKFCKKNGYGFIDISDLCKEHKDMYREDGTHLVSEFYPYWGGRILTAVLEAE